MPIADLRKEYHLAGLRRSDLETDPIVQFKKWFDEAAAAGGSGEVSAMTLATADQQGRPSGRTVLLKGVDQRGFSFFTNYESRKGRELAENPHAALVIHWPHLERQVCVAGTVLKLSRSEAEAYFKTRPRGSRIGTWASRQGEVVADRAQLEQQWREAEARYPGDDIPMPPYWGGYVLAPERLEFWQGRPNRLHDRFRYGKAPEGGWKIERLGP